jgi:hypothetical protein
VINKNRCRNIKSSEKDISGHNLPPRTVTLADIRIIACRLIAIIPITWYPSVRIRPDSLPTLRAGGDPRIIAAGTGTVEPVP